jgi:hypothetical protein
MHLLQHLGYKGHAYLRMGGTASNLAYGTSHQLKEEVEDRFRTAFSEHDVEALRLFVQSNAVGVDHRFRFRQGPKMSGLIHAARNGDKETTQTLLSLGADCNISCGDDTPLITALQHGKEEVALMLLEAGADPTGPHFGNVGVPCDCDDETSVRTLLGLAWETTKSARLIRALLQNGADPNAMYTIGSNTVGPEEFPADLKELVSGWKVEMQGLWYSKIKNSILPPGAWPFLFSVLQPGFSNGSYECQMKLRPSPCRPTNLPSPHYRICL